MQSQSQYAAASTVPLIKSPSLRVPKSVTLPQDIHPLPENVNAYFVYPFTLEPHILQLSQSRRQTINSHAARRQAYLSKRLEDKERRRKEKEERERKRKMDELRKIAPGFDGSADVMVPVKRVSLIGLPPTTQTSEMEGLVEGLARMSNDSSRPVFSSDIL